MEYIFPWFKNIIKIKALVALISKFWGDISAVTVIVLAVLTEGEIELLKIL